MSVAPPVLARMVIYAKDIKKVATFYKRTLSLLVLEEEPGFVIVGDVDLEIAVVKMPEALANEVHISVPPRVREETPMKFSFLVEDLDRVRSAATAAGGGAKPIAAAWQWRGQLHLDGHDPEGNVVQFRKRDA
ncbi:VOC family protein [Azomonas macrocytogenes]|uniref:Putative enzyme related to lactoylglutathione lyase n=1 Tax=Azomonas macrocytogenes TaxID=69962 RepID=A0A839T468_AZOMA|nr:VOC family protein [Azomonas macrocytogenes]MBB3103530.1 putative enzyme related to lactoylglutathione lyase [Azomonas macrocytogenes]